MCRPRYPSGKCTPKILRLSGLTTIRANLVKLTIIIALILAAAGIIAFNLLTIFIVQPIGALPEGKTLIITRLDKTKFVDSADAMCEREMGGVSLLCRGVMLGGVLKNSTIYARLPYSETLYEISTGGKRYGR